PGGTRAVRSRRRSRGAVAPGRPAGVHDGLSLPNLEWRTFRSAMAGLNAGRSKLRCPERTRDLRERLELRGSRRRRRTANDLERRERRRQKPHDAVDVLTRLDGAGGKRRVLVEDDDVAREIAAVNDRIQI